MKHCQFCGSEVNENSVFCENCGKDLTEESFAEKILSKDEKRCKTCGEIHNKKLKFCPNCGVNSRQIVAAKITQCKGCGHSIATNATECPKCRKKTHYNLKITGLIIGIFLFIIIISAILIGGSDTTGDANSNTNTPASVEQENNILYSDDFFDIEYMKLSDAQGITASYLQLKVTNKNAQKLMLLLDDVYVNDISIESGTGMPIELESGKISTSPFVLFTGNTGLNAEDITKIEFKLKGYDDSFNVVHTTSKILIEK